MRKLSSLPKRALSTAVVIGGLVTAYQASETTKKQGGSFTWDKFVPNFKTQAAQNIRLVGGAGKALAGKYFGLFTDSKAGKKSAVPENKTAKQVYETVKTVAPDVVEKVEDYVEDVKKNAPEYKAETEKAIDEAAESAIKYLGLEDEEKPAAEEKPAVEEKPAAEVKPVEEKPAAEKKPVLKEKKINKEKTADKPKKAKKIETDDKAEKPKRPRRVKKEDTEEKADK